MSYSKEKTLPVAWSYKNSSYYSAMVGIQTSDLPHSMTMSKEV